MEYKAPSVYIERGKAATLQDSDGNVISSHEQGAGDYHLGVAATLVGQQNEERHAWINPTNEQAVSSVYRMVGSNFDGATKDTKFWTDGSLLDGRVTQAGGEIDLRTNEGGATALSSAKYTSANKSRFVAGSAQLFNGGFNFKTVYTANNIRRVGAYTTTAAVNTPVDGFYFELSNTAFSVNSRANGGAVSSVASGAFNGNMGATWVPTADTYYQLTIEYTPLAAFFYVNNVLLHKKAGAHQSYFMTLPITIENLNTSGSTNVSFESVGMYMARQGELHTNPVYYYHALGTTAGAQLKVGAGILHRILINNVVNNSVITISDGTSGTTNPIMVHTAGDSKLTVSPIEIGAPFDNGLRLTVATQNASITLIYE